MEAFSLIFFFFFGEGVGIGGGGGVGSSVEPTEPRASSMVAFEGPPVAGEVIVEFCIGL